MSTFIGQNKYITVQARELEEQKEGRKLYLNPWNVQNIVYELIHNFMLTNDPKSMGYTFDQKYDIQKEKSQIYLDISYNWKAEMASKRPAIFISRGEATIKHPTIRAQIGSNAAESQTSKMGIVSLPISVMVCASPVGFVEQLADYVKQPFAYFDQVIQCDFKFLRFRLVSIGQPQIYVEAKDNFVVELSLQIEYNDNWIVSGDDLKLKTISTIIFDSVLKKPLEIQ